jgi:hypothetical protein
LNLQRRLVVLREKEALGGVAKTTIFITS